VEQAKSLAAFFKTSYLENEKNITFEKNIIQKL
jgi:hypothetical protein